MRFHYSADVPTAPYINRLKRAILVPDYYRRLRLLGVTADVALWSARLMARFCSPPTQADFEFVARENREFMARERGRGSPDRPGMRDLLRETR